MAGSGPTDERPTEERPSDARPTDERPANAGTTPPGPTVGWVASPDSRIPQLARYLATNRDEFTPEALRQAAVDAGYTPPEIEAATQMVRDQAAIRPIRGRARWIVVAAYVAVWVLFATQYLVRGSAYGGAYQGILTGALIVGLAISVVWLAWRKPDPTRVGRAMVVFLVVPVVLLVGIAGACLPFVQFT